MVSGSVGAVVASVGAVVGTVVSAVVGAVVGSVFLFEELELVFLLEELELLEPLLEELEELEVFFGVVALAVSEAGSSDVSVSEGSVSTV